ncbi:MAG: 7-cyano-7-deazaguanine synthase QueC [Candidatus Saelkia tenebricola]|nr:7-cyano-7-deazaguanine synthase QueC [Candidatus Saelkia tenebricola]
MKSSKKAVVLLSGGIDSVTSMFYALNKGFKLNALIFDYGQRHKRELASARKIAGIAGVSYKVVKVNFPWGGSVLLDKKSKLPHGRFMRKTIPSTYVPGRNIIFLSLGISYAEAISADEVFIGVNAVDYSGYPDCRPDFIKAFQKAVDLGIKSVVEGKKIKISVPLINLSKKEIIELGLKLGVPFKDTWSCYSGGANPCNRCDSCLIRRKGFQDAGIKDPLDR